MSEIKTCRSGLHQFSGERCPECKKIRGKEYTAENKEKKKAYDAELYSVNQKLVSARSAAYYAANTSKVKATVARYVAGNQETVKANKAAYYLANKDEIEAKKAVYRASNLDKHNARSVAWNAANPKKKKASVAKWSAANPETMRIKYQNRRAKKREVGGTLSKGLANKLFKLQKGKCPCCGLPLGDNYHLDHKMPLALGGPNVDSNIQLLRQHCNNQKA
jgi:hypothetical protein